jgi:hypothetical protein
MRILFAGHLGYLGVEISFLRDVGHDVNGSKPILGGGDARYGGRGLRRNLGMANGL